MSTTVDSGIFPLQNVYDSNRRETFEVKHMLGKGGFAKCYYVTTVSHENGQTTNHSNHHSKNSNHHQIDASNQNQNGSNDHNQQNGTNNHNQQNGTNNQMADSPNQFQPCIQGSPLQSLRSIQSKPISSNSRTSFAAKIVDKTTLQKPKTLAKLTSEISIHAKLNHPHIVGFDRYFEDTDYVYILLELCECRSMMELLKRRRRLTELEAKYLMIQILQGVKYMHENLVIHRDLKLGNLFLDADLQVKIGDFGLAAKLRDQKERKRTICGTPNYIAPEILCNRGHSYEVDVWSIGVILYTLLIGRPPFETSHVKTTYRKIRDNSYSFPSQIQISDDAKSLIESILIGDPSQRPTIEQILQHSFFVNEVQDLTKCPESLKEYAYYYTRRYPNYIERDYHQSILASQRVTTSLSYPISNSTGGYATRIRNSVDQPLVERVPFRSIQNTLRSAKSSNTVYDKKMIMDPLLKSNSSTTLKENSAIRPNENRLVQDFARCNIQEQHMNIDNAVNQAELPTVWVTHWADFSQKYGLAYRLNSQQTGAYFNDTTKMLYHHTNGIVDYYERKRSSEGSYDERKTHHIDQYPDDLNKKVTLIKYFKNFLDKEQLRKRNPNESASNINTTTAEIYVKRWLRTRHAIIFRLSNKTVQVCFFDNTEIILSSEAKLVTFRDESGNQSTFSLSSVVDIPQPEISKRLKYTKEVLKQLISDNRKINA